MTRSNAWMHKSIVYNIFYFLKLFALLILRSGMIVVTPNNQGGKCYKEYGVSGKMKVKIDDRMDKHGNETRHSPKGDAPGLAAWMGYFFKTSFKYHHEEPAHEENNWQA